MTDINTHTLTEHPLVSVVIPIYNRKKTLKKAVLSVVNQSYKNIELLLIDDCSTDGSAQLCDHFAHQYHIIRVIHQPKNGGVEQARYDAIKACKGEYVMFVDSDDWLEKGIINHCVQVAEREKVDAVHFNFYRTLDKYGLIKKKQPASTIYGRIEKDEIMQQIYPLYFGKQSIFTAVWGFLYRRDVFQRADIKPIGLKFGEDWALNVRLMPHMNSLYKLNIYGYYHLYGGVTATYNKDILQIAKQSYKIECEQIEKHQVDKEAYDYIAYQLKNTMLLKIRQLIDAGTEKEFIISFIDQELQSSHYKHLFQIYSTKENLSPINQAVKEKDANKIYLLSLKEYNKNKFRNNIYKIIRFLLNFFA